MPSIHSSVKILIADALKAVKEALAAGKRFSHNRDMVQYRSTVTNRLHDAMESLIYAEVSLEKQEKRKSSHRSLGKGSRNPSLVVYNPPGLKARKVNNGRVVGMIGERVYQVRYRHAEDGKDYYHDFGSGVKLFALDNGDVLITSDKPLWEEFE